MSNPSSSTSTQYRKKRTSNSNHLAPVLSPTSPTSSSYKSANSKKVPLPKIVSEESKLIFVLSTVKI